MSTYEVKVSGRYAKILTNTTPETMQTADVVSLPQVGSFGGGGKCLKTAAPGTTFS